VKGATTGSRLRHLTALATVLALIAGACGSARLSLTEYVDRLNAVVAEGNQRIRPLYAELESTQGDPSTGSIQELFEKEAAIRSELQDSMAGMEPPEQIADLHAALVDWHGGLIVTQQLLARQVAAAGSWSEFEQSPEFAEFDAFMQEGLAGCLELQAALDATEARGAFADTPWIPGELKEVVDAALGCEAAPGD